MVAVVVVGTVLSFGGGGGVGVVGIGKSDNMDKKLLHRLDPLSSYEIMPQFIKINPTFENDYQDSDQPHLFIMTVI